MIESQLAQAGPGAIAIIGDSRVETALTPPSISGRTVVNAGFGSATAGLLVKIVPSMFEHTHLSCAVIAVGINNARVNPVDDEDFEICFRRLTEIVERVSDRILLTTIAPVLAAAPLGVGYFSQEKIRSNNETINRLAVARGYGLIDLAKATSDTFGDLYSDFSVDGVHFTAAGYARWNSEITRGISSALSM